MKISVVGTGYVGLVSGACLADVGNDVLCLDVDAQKIKRLNDGDIPIYEPGLEAVVARNVSAGRLRFTDDIADIEQVRRGIGSDPRIGYHFLYPGCGYGGSCFPKDVQALLRTASDSGMHLEILGATEAVNERQKSVLLDKIKRRFGNDLSTRRFAIWGLAFKPNTDDMREAPSRVLIEALCQAGATVTAYDPAAMGEARQLFGDDARIRFAQSPIDVLQDSDALVIVTEWKEFRSPDFVAIKTTLREAVIFDGRNLYEPATVRDAGLEYYAIGRL